jgi:hypothetical protein
MSKVYEEEIDDSKRALSDHYETYPELEQEMYRQTRADVLKAERTAISDTAARGFISLEVYEELLGETDRKLAVLELLIPDVRSEEEALTGSDQPEDKHHNG